MRKKVNIQRDLESRKGISEDKILPEVQHKEENDDAKSETLQQPEDNQSPDADEKPKKRKGKAKGDTQEVQV